jgi:iron complex transport system ATP-binding protein
MSLELAGLAVDIGGQRIVSGIGLTVPDGTFAGLLGPNGSGKSTILKAIYRVHRPVAGRVLLDGADLLAMGPGTPPGGSRWSPRSSRSSSTSRWPRW